MNTTKMLISISISTYLIATYKAKYKWLINAYNTIFSNIVVLLIINSKVILELLRIGHEVKWSIKKTFYRLVLACIG